MAEFAHALLHGEDVGQDFQERGFARAVGADEDDAFVAFDFQIDAGVHDFLAIGVVDVGEADGALAAALGLREIEADFFRLAGGGLDFFHALDLLELALGLRGFAGFRAEAVGEFLEAGDVALLVFVGGEELLLGGFALDEVVVVGATVAGELGLADFEDAIDELVQELAVVGDHEDRAGIIFQIILKPEEGLEVEVVGRFVENEEVGFLGEQAGEVRAHDPAAAEFGGAAVEVAVAEAEAVEHLLGLGLDGGAVEFIEAGAGFVGFGGVLIVGGGEEAHFAHDADEFGAHRGGQLDDGFVADGGAFLREVADGGATLEVDGPVVGGFIAENQAQQRGLARAIRADQPDAIAAIHLQRHVLEKDAPAVRLG